MSAINRVGEGTKSPYSVNIIAAQVPGRPNPPTYISSTDTTITLQFYAVTDNGGSPITNYILYADDGNLTANNFSPVSSYNG